jgi:hypothetical protein
MGSKWIGISQRRPTTKDADEDGLVLILRKGGAIREASYGGVAFGEMERDPMMRITHWARMLPRPEH